MALGHQLKPGTKRKAGEVRSDLLPCHMSAKEKQAKERKDHVQNFNKEQMLASQLTPLNRLLQKAGKPLLTQGNCA